MNGAAANRIYEEVFGVEAFTRRRGGSAGIATGPRAKAYSPRDHYHIGARQRLANIAARNQALVKVVPKGAVKTRGELVKQIDYLSREGELKLEVGEGGFVQDLASDEHGHFTDLIEDWQADFELMDAKRMTNKTYHLVVSFPRGTDRMKAERIGSEFAEEFTGGRFGDVYKYAAVHHQYTDYPYTHIVINRLGESGRALQISRYGIDVSILRELQVEIAGRHGVELITTPRWSRAKVADTQAIGRLKAAEAGRPLPEKQLSPEASRTIFRERELEEWKALITGLKTFERISGSQDAKVLSKFVELGLTYQLKEERSDMVAQALSEKASEAADLLAKSQVEIDAFLRKNADHLTTIDFKADPERHASFSADFAIVRDQVLLVLEGDVRDKWLDYNREHTPEPIQERIETVRAAELIRNAPTIVAIQEKPVPVNAKETLEKAVERVNQRLEKADRDVVDLLNRRGYDGERILKEIVDGETSTKRERREWLDRQIQDRAQKHAITKDAARAEILDTHKQISAIYRDAIKDIRTLTNTVMRDAAKEVQRSSEGQRGQQQTRQRQPEERSR